jgi:hypothetical protein
MFLFSLGALLYFLGFCLIPILIFGKKHLPKGVYQTLTAINQLCIILPLGAAYTSIILYVLITDHRLLLDMSYSGVVKQYLNHWLQISSTLHFEYADLLVTYFALYAARSSGLTFKNVALFLPLMLLWNPIGSLTLGIYVTLHKRASKREKEAKEKIEKAKAASREAMQLIEMAFMSEIVKCFEMPSMAPMIELARESIEKSIPEAVDEGGIKEE